MLEEEIPQIVFTYIAHDGTVFRDALTFKDMNELRSTSKEEREVMMQERYNNWLIARSTPSEVIPEEE